MYHSLHYFMVRIRPRVWRTLFLFDSQSYTKSLVIHQREGWDSFCCPHLHIWFGGISRVCICPQKYIVLLLCFTLLRTNLQQIKIIDYWVVYHSIVSPFGFLVYKELIYSFGLSNNCQQMLLKSHRIRGNIYILVLTLNSGCYIYV